MALFQISSIIGDFFLKIPIDKEKFNRGGRDELMRNGIHAEKGRQASMR